MIIPLRTDSPLRRTPYMNYALIVANVIVFAIQVSYNAQTPESSTFTDPLILQSADPHLWQYVTYAFLHANLLHIFGNMLFLYIFGNNINDRMGNLGYLAFYLAGAVFAGLGYVVIERQGAVLGASGAVAAVTGAFLILMPRSNITIFYFFYLVGTMEIAGLWFILFFFLQDVIGEAMPQLLGGEAVAHAAHIAGTLFGATICIVLLAVRLLPRDQFDVVALAQRWNRRRQYRDLVNQGFDPFSGTPAPRSRAAGKPVIPDATAQRIMDLRARISQAVSDRDMAAAAAGYQELIGLDPNQVLSRSAQLDLANYLAHEQQYAAAVQAYEQFQRYYPTYDQIEQVYLMLGVIYHRYLNVPLKAKEALQKAIARLHFSKDLEMAKAELEQVEAVLGQGH